jgi:light-regulated signal transduction histidine kinase (bacteriophytochrome)
MLSVLEDQQRMQQEINKLNIELEQRVSLRTQQLEVANKELEAFSYSVSHDLRAPLRHISGFTEILSKSLGNNLIEKDQHYLNVINESARKMGVLIDDLLSFSRTGRTEMKKSIFNMSRVIEEAKSQIEPRAEGRKINWKISPLPDVNGDYNLLKLVWVNLLDNAVKYTQPREKAIIHIDYTESETEFIFCIRDNGVGFDMNYAQKLFGVFQRMHSSAEFEGTGIGLANVRRIILKHGGRIWAEAEVDKGAAFYFTLPK